MITKTSEASFRTEIAQYQEELDLSVINDQAGTKGNRTAKFNETEYSKIKELIPSFSSKYKNVLAIEEDKLVYKGNDKTLYKMALEIGLISEDELLDDEILEELQPFITEWTVDAGDPITLPIGGTCNFTVDYGDGTGKYEVTSGTDEDRIHTYETAGTYTITIKGKCTKFTFSNINISKLKITKINQWGSMGFTNLDFSGCQNLKGPIPNPSKNSLSKLDSLYLLFDECKNLDGAIPEKLFFGCKTATSARSCFYGCEKLTGDLPKNLFKDCININSFVYTFKNCKQLTGSIPENLFEKNINVTSFESTFQGCQNLTGDIPESLFKKNTSVTTFKSTFEDCQNLTGSIPEELFKNNSLVSSFYSTFDSCIKLSGNIPQNLFKNCTDASNFRSTFNGCKLLTGSIPQDLFASNENVSTFRYTFKGCLLLTGNAPTLWERNNVTDSLECFKNCTNLSNYNDIPSTWK